MCSRFDTAPACDRQTDRQTDGQTDGIAVASTALAQRALRRAVKTQKTAHWRIVGPMCNTVQLLQRSRLPFSSTVPHNSPKLNSLITRFNESYVSSVSMSCEPKRLKKSSNEWLNRPRPIQHLSENAIFVFSRFAR